MKGEKGKPKFKTAKEDEPPAKSPKMNINLKETWGKSVKNEKIKIDRIKTVRLDKTDLPEDLEFKGYEEKIIQNIIMQTDNVLYRMEKYYSPSLGKTYIAELDSHLTGTSFGPETKALINALYFENRVTENKIASFLNSNGLHISEGTISNVLTKGEAAVLTGIKNEIFKSGLESSAYQQIDDTGMNISGRNGYATIIGNEKYSIYSIRTSKSRETVISLFPPEMPDKFTVLVGDDAPQFKKITSRYALCWVHEERHYKKLVPILEIHREELENKRAEIWEYYDKLQDYKEAPTRRKKKKLWDDFDKLFNYETGYEELDNRMSLTLGKKSELLTVLDYPEIPLHNNLSENGLRELVIKRKISGGVKSVDGIKAWENNMSILSTCKKLGVSFYEFMKGVFYEDIIISLPDLIASS